MASLSAHRSHFPLHPRGFYNSARRPHKTPDVGGNCHNTRAAQTQLRLGSVSGDWSPAVGVGGGSCVVGLEGLWCTQALMHPLAAGKPAQLRGRESPLGGGRRLGASWPALRGASGQQPRGLFSFSFLLLLFLFLNVPGSALSVDGLPKPGEPSALGPQPPKVRNHMAPCGTGDHAHCRRGGSRERSPFPEVVQPASGSQVPGLPCPGTPCTPPALCSSRRWLCVTQSRSHQLVSVPCTQ